MFRFSIREMLLVLLVVGVGLGWWADRRRVADRLEYLEWKTGDVFTMSGSAYNVETLKRVAAEDAVIRKRFTGQAPPKRQATAKRLREVPVDL
jgi:hypothetical protein